MASVPGDTLVLVTGASGFIATHIIQQLQQEGYRVRGTVRSLQNEEKIKPIHNLCPDAKFPIELVEADLTEEAGWDDAVRGCTYVIHTASPITFEAKIEEEDMMVPVNNTLRVLKSAKAVGGVKRVVLTVTTAAVNNYLGTFEERIFTEEDWADATNKDTRTYHKMKILSEKAAWDFISDLPDEDKFELSVVHPGMTLGPILSGTISLSMEILGTMLLSKLPAVPALNLYIADVRDVALSHIRAMTVPEAAGKRHIVGTGNMWMPDIGKVIEEEFRPQGYNVVTRKMPKFVLWIGSFFDKSLAHVLNELNKICQFDNNRMKNVLGIDPKPMKEIILDGCYSMIERGHVAKTAEYRGRVPSGDDGEG